MHYLRLKDLDLNLHFLLSLDDIDELFDDLMGDFGEESCMLAEVANAFSNWFVERSAELEASGESPFDASIGFDVEEYKEVLKKHHEGDSEDYEYFITGLLEILYDSGSLRTAINRFLLNDHSNNNYEYFFVAEVYSLMKHSRYFFRTAYINDKGIEFVRYENCPLQSVW